MTVDRGMASIIRRKRAAPNPLAQSGLVGVDEVFVWNLLLNLSSIVVGIA